MGVALIPIQWRTARVASKARMPSLRARAAASAGPVLLLFARGGARLLVIDSNRDGAAETARLIAGQGGEAHAVAADVADEADVKDYVDLALKSFGSLDIVY